MDYFRLQSYQIIANSVCFRCSKIIPFCSKSIILFLYNASIMRLYCLYNGLTNIFFLFVFFFLPLLK